MSTTALEPVKNEAVQLLNLMTSFGADPKLVNEGRWVGFPTQDSPYKFKIARLNNRGQRAMSSRLMLENKKLFEEVKGSEEEKAAAAKARDAKLEELSTKVMAHQLLLDWTPNISLDGKTPLGEYTVEKAETILGKFADLRNWVEDQASAWGEYHLTEESVEEEAKN